MRHLWVTLTRCTMAFRKKLFSSLLSHHLKVFQSQAPKLSALLVVSERDLNQNGYKYHWNQNRRKSGVGGLFILGAAVAVASAKKPENDDNWNDNKPFEAGLLRPDLPIYRADEISTHDSKSSFWVIYKHGVYDVTTFLPSHPGGDQILNAGGHSIEPFWNVYGMHKTEEVFRLLETFRIGNIHEDDMITDTSEDELWAMEPARSERLLVKTAKPFNAETPPDALVSSFFTPNDLFYVRQHMPVPELDAATHRLRVKVVSDDGEQSSQEFSIDDLYDKFECVTLNAALMCAGNRRSEMNKVKPVKGLSWGSGAISQAEWRGVLLRDLLIHCGVDVNNTKGKHVVCFGSDIDATGVQFSTSIPLSQALNPSALVLVATHMNGEPLPLDHGYPLRVIVPGAPAVRSVKWLESITVSTEESQSHWHQKDYRSFNASKTWETADFPTAPPVYSLPVTSAICDPLDGDTVVVKDNTVTVKGYAYSGGGAKIVRVDISGDLGETWHEALLHTDDAPAGYHYCWTHFVLELPAGKQTEMEIWAKATDSNFNTQPENFKDIWNIRGILSNAYHKIKINLKHT